MKFLAPDFDFDLTELAGAYSPDQYSRKFAALLENCTVVTELYLKTGVSLPQQIDSVAE